MAEKKRKKKLPKVLQKMKERMFKELEQGGTVRCELCEKNARFQFYSFGMNEAVALIALISAVRWPMNRSGWAHWKKFYPIRNGLTQLDKWGLARSRKGKQIKRGYWKPTEKGIQFANNELTIIKTQVYYRGKLRYEEGSEICIRDRFKKAADYKEGMKAIGNKAKTIAWVGRMHNLDMKGAK